MMHTDHETYYEPCTGEGCPHCVRLGYPHNDRPKEQVMSVFNEDSLRADIVKVWGEHGAHVDVFDRLVKWGREAHLARIEAQNPGIDIESVKAQRGW